MTECTRSQALKVGGSRRANCIPHAGAEIACNEEADSGSSVLLPHKHMSSGPFLAYKER